MSFLSLRLTGQMSPGRNTQYSDTEEILPHPGPGPLYMGTGLVPLSLNISATPQLA
jgi:hypothetical protein